MDTAPTLNPSSGLNPSIFPSLLPPSPSLPPSYLNMHIMIRIKKAPIRF
jgi:hypothetical protein